MSDLWGSDIGGEATITPAAILREQASLLGPKTNHDVIGEVTVVADEAYNNRLKVYFYLVVPALNNYRYLLLSILHGVPEYPLIINAQVLEEQIHVPDQATFIERLKFILSSQKTKLVVSSLLGHVRDS